MSTIVKTKQRTIEFLSCPYCDKGTHEIAHIETGNSFGRWFCDDCGGSFSGKRVADDSIEITLHKERKIDTLDILVLPPQQAPVYFAVSGSRYTGGYEGNKRYYYEEHSCPINWLQPEMVYCNGDSDPHGLVKFVSSCDAGALPPDELVSPNAHDDALIGLIEAAIRSDT